MSSAERIEGRVARHVSISAREADLQEENAELPTILCCVSRRALTPLEHTQRAYYADLVSKAVHKFEAEFHRRLLVEVAEDLQRRDAELELRDLRLLELERELSEVRAKSAELTRKAERRDLLARLEHELLELRNAELVREAETAKR